MLSDCGLTCLSACNVGVLWPSGRMDQDKTCHAGSPRPRPHCVKWGPSSRVKWGPSFPSPKGAHPQFLAQSPTSATAELLYFILGTVPS